MASRNLIIALITLLSLAAAALGQISASEKAVVDAYRAAITSAETRPADRAIETALAALEKVSEALTRARDNQLQTALESLSEEEFVRLKRDLPGALVNREETIFVEPDPDYFLKLAGAYGGPADRNFFAAFKATRPDSVWPVYVEQQTDYSGCTAFGSGKLVEAYRVWDEFRTMFPDRYVVSALEQLEDVSRELTDSTCACGDSASVEAEMQRFIRVFPPSTVRSQVADRLEELHAGRTKIRLNCKSG